MKNKKNLIGILGWVLALLFFLFLFVEKTQRPKEVLAPVVTQDSFRIEPLKPLAIRKEAIVSRVIDGDTIVLQNGQRVRLIGIDTPERGRFYFNEAKDKLTELIGGRKAVLEKDVSECDRYGRLLRYIWLGEKLINLEMVKLGYANCSTYPPDVKYQDKILAAEREAREKQIGLWLPTKEMKD